MKNLLALLSTFLFALPSIGQNTEDTFAEGDGVLAIGVGVGGVFGFSGYDYQSPAFGIHYDHGIKALDMGAVIGVGGYLGYKGYGYDVNYRNGKYYDKWGVTILGARGSFHYDLLRVKNLDTYGGAMLAFHILNRRENFPNGYPYERTYSSALYASLYAGSKYYFNDRVSAFLELGYGVSWATVGAAFKL